VPPSVVESSAQALHGAALLLLGEPAFPHRRRRPRRPPAPWPHERGRDQLSHLRARVFEIPRLGARDLTGHQEPAFGVEPVTVDIARLAGRIEGQQEAMGIQFAFEDVLIGATALHLGYEVATLNLRDFQRIPGLSVIQL